MFCVLWAGPHPPALVPTAAPHSDSGWDSAQPLESGEHSGLSNDSRVVMLYCYHAEALGLHSSLYRLVGGDIGFVICHFA